jgi:hypothetical protein
MEQRADAGACVLTASSCTYAPTGGGDRSILPPLAVAQLTFGPLPGDHLSRDRLKGVATAASAGPCRRGHREFPWLGSCGDCRPAFDQHAGPSQEFYAEPKQDVPPSMDETLFEPLPVEDLGPRVHAERVNLHISALQMDGQMGANVVRATYYVDWGIPCRQDQSDRIPSRGLPEHLTGARRLLRHPEGGRGVHEGKEAHSV